MKRISFVKMWCAICNLVPLNKSLTHSSLCNKMERYTFQSWSFYNDQLIVNSCFVNSQVTFSHLYQCLFTEDITLYWMNGDSGTLSLVLKQITIKSCGSRFAYIVTIRCLSEDENYTYNPIKQSLNEKTAQ